MTTVSETSCPNRTAQIDNPTSVEHTNNRLLTAQWVLERNLSWIAAAEVKLGIVIALDTAMLGVLGSALSAARADNRTQWALAGSLTSILILGIALIFAAIALFPRVSGPPSSLVFFGKIAELDKDYFTDKFENLPTRELLMDCTSQIHRNAQIAVLKFKWVRRAMIFSLVSIAPWFLALVLLLRK